MQEYVGMKAEASYSPPLSNSLFVGHIPLSDVYILIHIIP